MARNSPDGLGCRLVLLGVVAGIILALICVTVIPNPVGGLLGRSVVGSSRQVVAPEVASKQQVILPRAQPTATTASSEGSGPTAAENDAVQTSPEHESVTPHVFVESESGDVDVAAVGPQPSNATLPLLLQHTEPKRPMVFDWDFDIVYLWVNGSDPALLASKYKYTNIRKTTDRDRDNGELRYSLRSLDKFMPWWNGTLFIVATETPCWLNVDHPRVRMMPHKQFFTNPAVLPVFNSQAIEANIHNIPGLRQHFVLTNDDVFFGAPLEPSDFFRDGKAVLRFEPHIVEGGYGRRDRVSDAVVWRGSMFTSRGMLERYFDLREGVAPPRGISNMLWHFLKHAPAALDRDRVKHLATLFPKEFAAVSKSRVRTKYGFHMAFVHHCYCLLTKGDCYALPQAVSDREASFFSTGVGLDSLRESYAVIRNGRYKFWNINDEQDLGDSFFTARYVYRNFLPSMFPDRSQYETSRCPPLPPLPINKRKRK